LDGQSVKTTERGGVRGFDGHKRVKGRKRHILVDTLGQPIANRVGPASMSDRCAGARLLGGLRAFFPAIRIVIADAGRESRELARMLKRHEGWELRIVKRRQRAFKITGDAPAPEVAEEKRQFLSESVLKHWRKTASGAPARTR
jgi:putative transposase